jgi:hypothetical protein
MALPPGMQPNDNARAATRPSLFAYLGQMMVAAI